MRLVGNIIWLLFGGLVTTIEYVVGGLIMCLTVVGIPFGLQAFKLASLALWPFNKSIQYTGQAPGCLSTLFNLLWIIVAGFWIAATHLLFGILLTLTLVGIPWANQHFKLMSLALTPFGRTVVRKA